jgi:citryl-CoA lyase
MKFATNISRLRDGEHTIYGHAVTKLMREATFTDTIFLLFGKRIPTVSERKLLDTLLVAAAEHGVEAPSLYVPRISAASGNSIHAAMAAGVLAIGEAHGGAGEAAARFLLRDESAGALVSEYLAGGKKIPGFGHKIYFEEDPRAAVIFAVARENNLPLAMFEKAYAIEAELFKQKAKKLVLNVDGAYAAAILALGLEPVAAKALFVIARAAGMGAHAMEEIEQGNAYKRLPLL